MSKEEIEKLKKEFEWGSKEREEICLREMINSCWCYGTNCYNTHYITNYFENGRIEENRVWEIVKEQLNYLNNNCTIKKGTYVDDEGNVYYSIIEKEVA